MMVVKLSLASVRLGPGVCLLGPLLTAASMVVAVIAGTTAVFVVGLTTAAFVGCGTSGFFVAASLSTAVAEVLLRRKPEEEKKRHDCEQTGALTSCKSGGYCESMRNCTI